MESEVNRTSRRWARRERREMEKIEQDLHKWAVRMGRQLEADPDLGARLAATAGSSGGKHNPESGAIGRFWADYDRSVANEKEAH